MNKRYFLIVGTLFVVANLSGCAKMMQNFGYFPVKKPVPARKACESATVLFTNLKRKAPLRRYMLTDGRACPVLNPRIKTKKPKKQQPHY